MNQKQQLTDFVNPTNGEKDGEPSDLQHNICLPEASNSIFFECAFRQGLASYLELELLCSLSLLDELLLCSRSLSFFSSLCFLSLSLSFSLSLLLLLLL